MVNHHDGRGSGYHGRAFVQILGEEVKGQLIPPRFRPFPLRFADLSPYIVMEILDLEPAQQDRFLKAYDTTKLLLKDLKIFPRSSEVQKELGVNDLQREPPQGSWTVGKRCRLSLTGELTDGGSSTTRRPSRSTLRA